MDQFIFRQRYKNILFAFMAIGIICMAWTWFSDDALHTRFWSNFFHNTMYFTGIAFAALLLMTMGIVTYGMWFVAFKRIWEAYSMFLITGIILMLVIIGGVWFHYHHIYHWTDAQDVAKDVVLNGKSGFLNPWWYTIGTIVTLGAWAYFAVKLRSLSRQQDNNGGIDDVTEYNQMKRLSAIFLPVGGFLSSVMIWQWIMSVDAHWYSTLFAWYATASWVVACFAFTALMIIFLKGQKFMDFVTVEHMHDVGKFVFAMTIFWAYLWFAQFMLIWYGNNGEETIYFNRQMQEYPVMFWGNVIINFVLPFLVLLSNYTKRKVGPMVFICLLVFFGHWWDFFLMIKPGMLHTAHEELASMGDHGAHGAEHVSHFVEGFTIPGLLELGTMLGFFGLFVYVTFVQLGKLSLRPKNDPLLPESLHHHVQ